MPLQHIERGQEGPPSRPWTSVPQPDRPFDDPYSLPSHPNPEPRGTAFQDSTGPTLLHPSRESLPRRECCVPECVIKGLDVVCERSVLTWRHQSLKHPLTLHSRSVPTFTFHFKVVTQLSLVLRRLSVVPPPERDRLKFGRICKCQTEDIDAQVPKLVSVSFVSLFYGVYRFFVSNLSGSWFMM